MVWGVQSSLKDFRKLGGPSEVWEPEAWLPLTLRVQVLIHEVCTPYRNYRTEAIDTEYLGTLDP